MRSEAKRTHLTVTISPELGLYVKEVAKELGITKSALVEAALLIFRDGRIHALLKEGYLERAEHDAKLIKEFEGGA